MAESVTLDQARKSEQKLKTNIFRFKRKYKQLSSSEFLPDVEACQELKQELTTTINQLEEIHACIIQEFSITVDPKKESDQFESTMADFVTLLDSTNRLLLKIQFDQQSSKIEFRIKVLEQNMREDTEATVVEGLKDAQDSLDCLSSIQLTSRADSDQLESLTSRLTQLKIESDKRLKTAAASLRSSSGTPLLESETKSSTGKVHVRLPKLELPSFDGDYLNWPIFWERFSTAIDQNSSLSDEEKLAYLRGAMKGKLAQQIASPPTGDVHTYSTILSLLKEEYDNPREIHRRHVKSLLEAKGYSYNHEDVSKLKALWEKHLSGLRNTKQFDAEHILTSIAILNMSPKFYTEWSKFTSSYEDVPPIETFQKFLKELSKTLRRDTEEPSTSKISHSPSIVSQKKKPSKAYVHVVDESSKCLVCSNDYHPLYFCSVFKSTPIDNRIGLAKKANVCTNCLNGGHKTKDCKSSKRCQTCNNKHHSMLHRDDKPPLTTANANSTSEAVTSMNSVLLSSNSPFSSSLLMTAQVIIKTSSGRRLKIRVLLDSGSSASLLTSQVVTQLGLHKERRHTVIKGIQGDSAKPSQFTTSFCAEANSPHKEITVTAAVVDHITSHLPAGTIEEAKSWEVIQGLQLADPTFHIPGRIDALFGMDVLSDILLDGMLSGQSSEPKAFKTIFGWVIAGNYQGRVQQTATSFRITCEESEPLDELLQRFWASEEPPASSLPTNLTDEEQSVVDHFNKTTVQHESGRYQVSLPKKSPFYLGDSRELAVKRFKSVEKTLRRKNSWPTFQEAMEDYFTSGHAEAIPSQEPLSSSSPVYYMPMHVVVKPSSTTTKTRIVFDASARTSNGLSLNDMLLNGPNVYPEITTQILKFRTHGIGMTADISQMFRQIIINPSDRDLHRFVYRAKLEDPIKEYRMVRLTFGVTCSPYLATEILRQLARDNQHLYPRAAEIVLTDFYVDDLLTGCHTVAEAVSLRKEINELLEKGGFLLRKWRSNSNDLLESIPTDLKETETAAELNLPDQQLKTLGIHWHTTTDSLHIATPKITAATSLTKRQMVSGIAQLYDVMGWFTPVTFMAKCYVQKAWTLKLGWDDDLPDCMLHNWNKWVQTLHLLTEKAIPRPYSNNQKQTVTRQIHGFSDASEKGFAAVIYLRTVYSDTTTDVTLITGKSKVAPLKPETIPRLELAGALLLAKLMFHVSSSLNISTSDLYAWCDATIVLTWLDGKPRQLGRYVANRVQKISELLPATTWKYVSSKDNPADCGSRGLLPHDLINHQLWWSGPPWLKLAPEHWPVGPGSPQDSYGEDVMSFTVTLSVDLLCRFSSLTNAIRVIARVFRFINKLKGNKQYPLHLELEELNDVLTKFISLAQLQYFATEVSNLQDGKDVKLCSPLKAYKPVLDAKGIIRVGGRLQLSHLRSSQKHPILLSSKSKLSHLLMIDAHHRLLHAGPSQMVADLSQSYQILSARKLARSIYRRCVLCRRQRSKTMPQLMGALPTSRFKPGHPFLHTGIDYAGPITLKLGRVRKPVHVKAYICIFVSFSVKAVHLELVSDLTSEAFIATLRRFVARRGKPLCLHSDHGTNFVGASNILQSLATEMSKTQFQTSIIDTCSSMGIDWKFIPERAPNFGGLWESTVKSVKRHLYTITKGYPLTFEEASTLLTQIEAILNSRPLTALSSEDSNLTALTPGHFLIGQSLTALPDCSYTEMKVLRRWNLVQSMTQDFWQRWSTEYLCTLNKLQKWRSSSRNLSEGDLVLIKDERTSCCSWPLARIVRVFPGQDNKVRVADVLTNRGTYRRSVSKLVPLLQDEDQVAEATNEEASRGEYGHAPGSRITEPQTVN